MSKIIQHLVDKTITNLINNIKTLFIIYQMIQNRYKRKTLTLLMIYSIKKGNIKKIWKKYCSYIHTHLTLTYLKFNKNKGEK